MTNQNTIEEKKNRAANDSAKESRDIKKGIIEGRYGHESAEKIRKRAKKILLFFTFLISSWIISSSASAFSTYPFGIVFISAAWSNYVAVGMGVLLSYLFSDMESAYLFAYITVAAVRVIMIFAPMPVAERELQSVESGDGTKRDAIEGNADKKRGLFGSVLSLYNIEADKRDAYSKEISRQRDIFSILFSAVGGFVAGLFDLIANDFSFYSLYGCLFMTFACPLFAYLLSGGIRQSDEVSNFRFNLGVGACVGLLIFASDDKMLFGMMMTPIISMAALLFACDRKGIAFGLTAGALIGLVFSAPYIPLFLICAIIYCMLIKIKNKPECRADVKFAVDAYRAKVIDYTNEGMCIEVTGDPSKIDAFIKLMIPFGVIEMCRTGIVALERGTSTLLDKE